MLCRQGRLFYRRAWAPASICHVSVRRRIETRSINTPSTSPVQDAGRQIGSRWIDPRQCIVDTANPHGTTESDVLARLGKFWRTRLGHCEDVENTSSQSAQYNEAVVILATPSFARWLRNDTEFIQHVLKYLAPHGDVSGTGDALSSPRRVEPASGFKVNVLCACVDGLAPDLEWIKTQNATYRREGFAFLHGRVNNIVPDLWQAELKPKVEDDDMFQLPTPSSITFASYQNADRPISQTEVIMPLANTLFINGKESMMFASEWQFNRRSLAFEKVKSQEKKQQVINVFGNDTARRDTIGFPPAHIPTIPLTPPRQIASGLGNIIRELNFDEGVIGPASKELEANVNEYMSMMHGRDPRVGAWALITPSESMPNPPQEMDLASLTTTEGIKASWSKGVFDSAYIGNWLNRGAILCNIVSGGGGWGIGGGLLSLDPQVTPNSSGLAPFDSRSESDSSLSTGGLAQPGSYIQFFIAPKQTESRPQASSAEDALVAGGQYSLTAVGSIPKELDRMPEPASQVDGMNPENSNDTNLRPGVFGAVSESGLFIRSSKPGGMEHADAASKSPQTRVQSRVNYPYAYFYRDLDGASEK